MDSEQARHEALGLTADDLLAMYRYMLAARAFDERTMILERQGKIPFTVTGVGHEGAQVGAAWSLRKGIDIVLPYYRDVGVMLVLGMTPYEMMLGEFAACRRSEQRRASNAEALGLAKTARHHAIESGCHPNSTRRGPWTRRQAERRRRHRMGVVW